MKDDTCISFLQWCLPRLGLRWEGFRKVRGQVCKRITGRLQELQIRSIHQYKEYLKTHDDEWHKLYTLCFATVSKFYRDHRVFETLENHILPWMAKDKRERSATSVRCWSAGCCSGEEPYTLNILWKLGVPEELTASVDCEIIATDYKEYLIERAKSAKYPESSIRALPQNYRDLAFKQGEDMYHLNEKFKQGVEFRLQDIQQEMPEGIFDIVLCRNLVFTYFEKELQINRLQQIVGKIQPMGYLIIGEHESLPVEIPGLRQLKRCRCIYRKVNV